MSIYPYQTREVRDLAWACFSPALMDTARLAGDQADVENCGFTLTPLRRAWLENLDRDASPLLTHLSVLHSRRLGVYFESLWHFFLAQDPEVELVAHNLPVTSDGRTLGEFDCIYFCRRRQRHVHLELAVKFYLGWRDAPDKVSVSDWSDWLGPELRDRLDLKISHLLQRQIRLGEREPARQLLHKLGIHDLQREIEIKGYLFRPFRVSLPPPAAFNPGRALNNWLRLGALPEWHRELAAPQYLPLPRPEWLAPARLSGDRSAIPPGELRDKLEALLGKYGRPQLVAALDDQGMEVNRFFVTGPGWPEQFGGG
jgi:hypothetical protein